MTLLIVIGNINGIGCTYMPGKSHQLREQIASIPTLLNQLRSEKSRDLTINFDKCFTSVVESFSIFKDGLLGYIFWNHSKELQFWVYSNMVVA
jgi:hypothetical protein